MTTPKPSEKDRERARTFWRAFYGISPFQANRPHEDVTVPMLGAQFAAVRAEERAKVVAEIVAWLGAATEDAAIWAMEIERKWSGK